MNVLFVCTENAGRSQLAEHLFNAGADRSHRARSAGTRPRSEVYPAVLEALRRRGVNVGEARPKPLTDEILGWADRVITMGCGDECPVTGKPTEDWDLPDAKGSPAHVEALAGEIGRRVSKLLGRIEAAAGG